MNSEEEQNYQKTTAIVVFGVYLYDMLLAFNLNKRN